MAAEDEIFGGGTSEEGPDTSGTQTEEPAVETTVTEAQPETQTEETTGEAEGPEESGTQEAEAKKFFGRYDSLEEAEKGYKNMQSAYQRYDDLVKRLGGAEVVEQYLNQQGQQPQAQQQQQPATPQQPDAETIDTPWGQLTKEQAAAKYWEVGPETYSAQMSRYEAQKTFAPVLKQQNLASVQAQLGEKYADFNTLVPTMLKEAQSDPELAQEIDALATDPAKLGVAVERLYWMTRGKVSEKAVAEARKSGEQSAQLREEQQTAASAGTQAGRSVSQAPKTEDPYADIFGKPLVGQ